MGTGMHGAATILVPPAFDYLPEVFLPDIERARCAARLTAAVRAARRCGARVGLDLGDRGLTAAETAAGVAEDGWPRAIVVAGQSDPAAALTLVEALEARGIPVETAAEDLSIETMSGEGAPRPAEGPVGGAWLVAPTASEDLPADENVFREAASGRLERAGCGPRGMIPAHVTSIRFCTLEEATSRDEWSEPDGVMRVLVLPERAEALGEPEALDAFFRARDVRLHFASAPVTRPERDGAAWARRLRLHDGGWRQALRALVTRVWPGRRAWFESVLAWHHLGLDPQEEMYAGNHLADRNAELLVNIVP